jgi:hypothetical protein
VGARNFGNSLGIEPIREISAFLNNTTDAIVQTTKAINGEGKIRFNLGGATKTKNKVNNPNPSATGLGWLM